jgi:hypothetical protein
MICGLCKGSGNLFCLHDGSRNGGVARDASAPVSVMYGAAVFVFSLSGGKRKVLARAERNARATRIPMLALFA